MSPVGCSLVCFRPTVYLGRDSRALIEQSWAWLELGVRVFCLRVSVLSVYAAGKRPVTPAGKQAERDRGVHTSGSFKRASGKEETL